MIWERFVASQMASAIMDTVTARLINNNVQFRASGSVVKVPRIYESVCRVER
ncbi:hypothetical protein ACT7DZ_36725 [Bacillus cereus]